MPSWGGVPGATPQPKGVTAGLISWFGGPNDKTTTATTASGAPVTTPGIAVYNRSTLGGWWMVKLPNGVISLVRQTDIGPSPNTGRTFDFTYSVLHALGYSQQSFPTNGAAQGVYLGGKGSTIQQLTASSGAAIGGALQSLGATPSQGQTFIAQLDPGNSSKQNANVIAVDTQGHPASDKSTALTGDATPANIIPSPSISTPSWAGALTTVLQDLISPSTWLRVIEFIGGSILVFMAIKSLTGAQTPSIVGAAAKVAK